MRLFGACAVGFLVLLAAVPSAGAQADSGVGVAVVAGIDGTITESRGFPIVIDVTAERLVQGTVTAAVEGNSGIQRIQTPIEVASGTTKRVVLTAISDGASFGQLVEVEVSEGGDVLARAQARVSADQVTEQVGHLEQLAGAVDRADFPLVVDAGTAHLSAVAPEVLAEGAVALEVYDQIAVTAGDLEALSSASRSTLSTWISQGGSLLVDEAPTTDLPGLAPELVPEGTSARVVGLGQVRFTGGLLAAGRWDEVIVPTTTRSQVEDADIASGVGFGGDVTFSLSADAGFDFPELDSLLLLLGAYVFVVGPVLWFVFTRARRTTMLWIGIPVVAALATVTVQVGGSEFERSGEAVHVTVLETGPGGAMATSTVLVSSARGGTTVALPAGWAAASSVFSDFGQPRNVVLDVGDRVEIPVDPGVGGASLVRARGVTEVTGALVVEAISDEDGVARGTVENTFDVPMHEVAVFFSRASVTEIGTIGPGETAEWVADDATRFDFDISPEQIAWPFDDQSFGPDLIEEPIFGPDGDIIGFDTFPTNPGSSDVPGVTSLAAFGEVAVARGANFKPPAQAVVVGWTRDLTAPLRVGGDEVRKGRTAVVTRATVTSSGSRLIDTGSPRYVIRGPEVTADPPDFQNEAILNAVFAFVPPAGVDGRPLDPARLRFHLPSLFARAEVWAGGKWVRLPEVAAGGSEVVVPPDSITQGQIFVKVTIPFFVPDPGREFVLYEAETP